MTTSEQLGLDVSELIQEGSDHFRVHGSVYTNPAIFEMEMDKIFYQGWIYVGHVSEIPEPGDYRRKWIGQQSVIMSRDEDGQVQLLMNRCRHRANAVCNTESGNATYFRCPYHGWTYKNSGELAGVTYADAYDGLPFQKEEMGLTKVPRTGEHRGFLFASLNPTAVSLDEHLGGAKYWLDLYADNSPEGEVDLSAGISKFSFKANWKFVLENTQDGYHPRFTHQSSMRRAGTPGRPANDSQRGLTKDLGQGHTLLFYKPFTTTAGLAALDASVADGDPWMKTYVEALERQHGKERTAEVLWARGTMLDVFPNLKVILGGMVRQWQPLQTDYTEFNDSPALLRGVPEELNIRQLRGHEAFRTSAGGGTPDDDEMFERNQMGLSAAVNPWLDLSRGLARQYVDDEGAIVGQVSDEVTQRGIWRAWRQAMTSS